MVNSPPALPDLLVALVAGGTAPQVIPVLLDHPPPVTGVRTEAFAGAQGIQEHWAAVTECSDQVTSAALSSHLTRLEMFCTGC